MQDRSQRPSQMSTCMLLQTKYFGGVFPMMRLLLCLVSVMNMHVVVILAPKGLAGKF
ncbi:unnamed protein product [Rhodiola kirilowii]